MSSAEDSQTFSGKCKWFNVQKGYGFIERPDHNDIFVHNTSIKHSKYRVMHTGENVEFQIRQSSTGRAEAYNVTGPGGAECSGSVLAKVARKHRCYNCGQFTGHFSRDCPRPRASPECYRCRSTSHRRADCPELSSANNSAEFNPSDSGIGLDTSTDAANMDCELDSRRIGSDGAHFEMVPTTGEI